MHFDPITCFQRAQCSTTHPTYWEERMIRHSITVKYTAVKLVIFAIVMLCVSHMNHCTTLLCDWLPLTKITGFHESLFCIVWCNWYYSLLVETLKYMVSECPRMTEQPFRKFSTTLYVCSLPSPTQSRIFLWNKT